MIRKATNTRKQKAAQSNGKSRRQTGQVPELGLVRISVAKLKHPPENDLIYRPLDEHDRAIQELVASIREKGVLEPPVVSADLYIISGNRRVFSAKRAGHKSILCRRLAVRRSDDLDAFTRLLREHNRQRDKSRSEKLREELIAIDPEEAHVRLWQYRQATAALEVETLALSAPRSRAAISDAKAPLLAAIQGILTTRKRFWPLSDRQIHYALVSLPAPPLRHACKPDSRYENTPQAYKCLCDLLTRGRLTGEIPWAAIDDPTRPVDTWRVYEDPRSFLRVKSETLFQGYARDLQATQPNHLEIVGEKNTARSIIRPVAMEFCIPFTTGRGYCSLQPRYHMANRFKRSGKAQLVLLMLTDHDPDGEEIAESFARSMRDDFGIQRIQPIKVALTREQVQQYQLPPVMQAKESSANHDKFVGKHGNDVYELEALSPEQLQEILRAAIESVIDRDALNHEIAEEKKDAAFIEAMIREVRISLRDLEIDEDE